MCDIPEHTLHVPETITLGGLKIEFLGLLRDMKTLSRFNDEARTLLPVYENWYHDNIDDKDELLVGYKLMVQSFLDVLDLDDDCDDSDIDEAIDLLIYSFD